MPKEVIEKHPDAWYPEPWTVENYDLYHAIFGLQYESFLCLFTSSFLAYLCIHSLIYGISYFILSLIFFHAIARKMTNGLYEVNI